MQLTEDPAPIAESDELDKNPTGILDSKDPIASDRGIEFLIEGLPFVIQNSPLSEFRSGEILLKNGVLSVDGRDTVPEYLRAKLYSLGSILFLPGLALTYYLIEQVSWIPASFKLTDNDILAYSTREHYCIISILYNRSGSDGPSARRTLTFQLTPGKYQRVIDELGRVFPGKRTQDRPKPGHAAGAYTAILGIIIWVSVILGTILWRPT